MLCFSSVHREPHTDSTEPFSPFVIRGLSLSVRLSDMCLERPQCMLIVKSASYCACCTFVFFRWWAPAVSPRTTSRKRDIVSVIAALCLPDPGTYDTARERVVSQYFTYSLIYSIIIFILLLSGGVGCSFLPPPRRLRPPGFQLRKDEGAAVPSPYQAALPARPLKRVLPAVCAAQHCQSVDWQAEAHRD